MNMNIVLGVAGFVVAMVAALLVTRTAFIK